MVLVVQEIFHNLNKIDNGESRLWPVSELPRFLWVRKLIKKIRNYKKFIWHDCGFYDRIGFPCVNVFCLLDDMAPIMFHIHRVVSHFHHGHFSGIKIIPGWDPTGSGTSWDSTGLSSFWDHLGSSVMEPGWCRDLVQKHDFITFCIRHHVVSIQLLQPKLVAPIIDMIIICYLILLLDYAQPCGLF